MQSLRALILILMTGLAACGGEPPPEYRGSAIPDAGFGRSLALRDHTGRDVTLETFRNKYLILAFGYTHCPDVCPTTLSDLAGAMKLLGEADAARVQVLFVTLDPERDTQEVLSAYVPYFHPGFLGLVGAPEQVASTAREFRVAYRKHEVEGASDYLLDHSAGAYVLDEKGKIRLYLPYGQKPEDITHDLKLLMHRDRS